MTENESNEEKLEQRRTEGCPDELAPVESKKAADKSFPVVGLGASAGGQGYQRISGANSASGYCGKTQSLAHRPILKIPCPGSKKPRFSRYSLGYRYGRDHWNKRDQGSRWTGPVAQSRETADHGGMPASAMHTGLVDIISAPEEMPQKIIDYYTHTELSRAQKTHAATDLTSEQKDWLNKVFAILRTRKGHDFSNYKSNTISKTKPDGTSGNRPRKGGLPGTGEGRI